MSDRSDVVDRADALMRGRRSFVRAGETSANDDEDLPVLTEVVHPAPAADKVEPPVAPAPAAAPGEAVDEAQLAELGAEMAQAIAQQLHFELPTLIEAAMASASEELRAGIRSTIDDAVRDFIAQHRRSREDADKHK